MDIVPLTIFFMVCLLNCLGFIIGTPTSSTKAVSNTWPESCIGKVYCEVKPHDYPSDGYLINLYDMYKDKAPKWNETTNRQGDICRNPFDYIVEKVYMIKDEKDNIRYALYIPGVFFHKMEVIECKPNTFEYSLFEGLSCQQTYTQYSFFVLTHDMKGLEVVKSAEKIPSNCQTVKYEYEYE